MSNNNEILPLTGLRFVAAFYVFLFHMQIRWPIAHHRFMANILGQGAIAMSLFFMLSGFLLAYRYANLQFSYRSYVINRFARIYPVYFVAAVLTLPWIGVHFVSDSLLHIIKSLGQYSLIILANIFLVQAWLPQFFSYWNDGGSWSISVEAFCYLLLPLFLPYLTRMTKGQLSIIAPIFMFLAILPGLSVILFDGPLIGVFYSMPIFRLFEFLTGSCLFLLIRFGVKTMKIPPMFVITVFLIYIGLVGNKYPVYISHDWIVLPTIAFLIYSLTTTKGYLSSLLSSSIFVWLGRISYSFYSFQVLLILSLVSYHDRLVEMMPVLSNNFVLVVVSFTTLVFMSALGYYLIEEPARRGIKRFYAEREIEKAGVFKVSVSNIFA